MTTTDRRACVNWHRLATDLEMKRARHHLSVRAAAEQIGIPSSAVVKLRHGGKLSADSVARVVTWLYPHEVPTWITGAHTDDPVSPSVTVPVHDMPAETEMETAQ